jgi:predicted outer membrane protein
MQNRYALPCLSLALAMLGGCSLPQDSALTDYTQWYSNASAEASAGMLTWSQFYQQSFDRLTALPSSLQQDARLESTVLMLSVARRFEAHEIGAQQFAMERSQNESVLEARLR